MQRRGKLGRVDEDSDEEGPQAEALLEEGERVGEASDAEALQTASEEEDGTEVSGEGCDASEEEDGTEVSGEEDECEPEESEEASLTIRCGTCNLFGTPDTTQPCGNVSCLHRVCMGCSMETDYCMECEDYEPTLCEESDWSSSKEHNQRIAGEVVADVPIEEDFLDDRDLPAHVALKWAEWFAAYGPPMHELSDP
eukprot:5247822-Amphidinium_carterae.1